MMEITKQILFRTARSGFLNSGFPVTCQTICWKSNFHRRVKNADLEGQGTKAHAKKHRQYAQLNYQEWRYPQAHRAIDISSTPEILKPYKAESGLKSKLSNPRQSLNDARKRFFDNRLLKKHVPQFHVKRFPAEAQQIYIDAHNLLNSTRWTLSKRKDTEEELHNLVTELAYGEMVQGLESKTVIWNWVETIEPPSVVQILCNPMVDDNNYYAQVTVKLHSKQTLAVYDRFGSLMFGDRLTPRNVLEYVVYERHIAHPYGRWRIHGKINNDDYEREPMRRTIAFNQRHAQRTEADDWHKEEREIHEYKWYPVRHNIIRKTERRKRRSAGTLAMRKLQKRIVLFKRRTGLVRMRGLGKKVVRRKIREIERLRAEGKLPKPPVGEAEPDFQ